MGDGFDGLIDDANAFFGDLRDNNRRDWFEPRKESYRDRIRKPADLLADLVAEGLARRTGVAPKPKVFRIHRDVRFSADKTPYNPHLHLSWFPETGSRPGWFFGSAPDYLMFACGIPTMQGADLTRFREAVHRDGAGLEAVLTAAGGRIGATLSDWGPAPLKRVPKPYDADHPHAALLRRKSLVAHADLPDAWRDRGLVPTLEGMADALLPLWRWLDGAMAEATA